MRRVSLPWLPEGARHPFGLSEAGDINLGLGGANTLIQPILDQYGADMTPDQLPAGARQVYDSAVGWLNENIPDENEQAVALGVGKIGLQVYDAIRSNRGDAFALFNTIALSIGALVPAAAPIVGLFLLGVDGMISGLKAAGLMAKGSDDPCSQHGEKWYGNVDLAHEMPPSDPSDPRWVHWDQDAGCCVRSYDDPNLFVCGWLGLRDIEGGHWLKNEIDHPPTPFDAAFDHALAMAYEAYANAKGPPPDPKAILTIAANVWNKTHQSQGGDDWYTARRAAFGRGGHDQQFYSGSWHDVNWGGASPANGPGHPLGSDARFADYVLGLDDRQPLELQIHTGPLVPELAALESLAPRHLVLGGGRFGSRVNLGALGGGRTIQINPSVLKNLRTNMGKVGSPAPAKGTSTGEVIALGGAGLLALYLAKPALFRHLLGKREKK